METAPGPRGGPGAVVWLRFEWPRASSRAEEGADRDAAVDDRRLERLDLGLDLGRDLAVEVVERRRAGRRRWRACRSSPRRRGRRPTVFLITSRTETSMAFCAEVRIAAAYSGMVIAWSLSTPIAHLPASSMALIVPLPVSPATGWTMSTPWSRKVWANCSPFAGSFQVSVPPLPPTKVPVSVGSASEPSQPRSLDGRALLLVVVLDAGVEAVHEPGHARERLGRRRCAILPVLLTSWPRGSRRASRPGRSGSRGR